MTGHGGRIFEAARKWGGEPRDWLDFSANINPLGISPKVKAVLRDSIQGLVHYPDDTELKSSLAEFHGISPSNIHLTNGAAEAFFLVVNALNPKTALLLEPTFSEYRRALTARDVDIRQLVLQAENQFAVPWLEVARHWQKEHLLVVCNPNNPTGTLMDRHNLVQQGRLARENQGWVLIDESFQDFLPEENSLIGQANLNTVIVRSLTKFFAIPGLRLGYIIAHERLIQRIQVQTPGWNVNSLGLAAGIAALQDAEYIQRTIAVVAKGKEDLYNSLKGLGARAFEPGVNYILFQIPGRTDLDDYLMQHKMLIRSCSNFTGLGPDWYRAAVRLPHENERLLGAIVEYLGG